MIGSSRFDHKKGSYLLFKIGHFNNFHSVNSCLEVKIKMWVKMPTNV
jgi:hypothetical protein